MKRISKQLTTFTRIINHSKTCKTGVFFPSITCRLLKILTTFSVNAQMWFLASNRLNDDGLLIHCWIFIPLCTTGSRNSFKAASFWNLDLHWEFNLLSVGFFCTFKKIIDQMLDKKEPVYRERSSTWWIWETGWPVVPLPPFRKSKHSISVLMNGRKLKYLNWMGY